MLVYGRRAVELIVKRLPGAVALANLRVFFRQIECVSEPAASQHVESARREAIHRLELAGIGLAAQAVEARTRACGGPEADRASGR
jgi:hypothetical protein